MNIYVGNLPYSVKDDELRATFAEFGDVVSAEVIVDRRTRRSRGYGFVQMASDDAGRKAIDALDGSDLQGRALRVDQSKPKQKKENGRSGDERRHAGRNGHDHSAAAARSHDDDGSDASVDSPGGLFGFFRKLFG